GGVRGEVAERRVRLEHVVHGRPDRADLEEVVHHADVLEAVFVSGPGHVTKRASQRRGALGPREVGDLESDLHQCISQSSLSVPPTILSLRPVIAQDASALISGFRSERQGADPNGLTRIGALTTVHWGFPSTSRRTSLARGARSRATSDGRVDGQSSIETMG